MAIPAQQIPPTMHSIISKFPPLRVIPFSEKDETLTPREKEVMELVVQDKTNKEIGEILQIRRGTVDSHLSRSYRKLKSKTREGAVVQFILRRSPTSFGLGSGPHVD